MKKERVLKILYMLLIVATTVCIMSACEAEKELLQEEYYTVEYKASEGGHLLGTTTQCVEKGGNTIAVTAMPDEGYIFVGWNDGKTDQMRSDRNITANVIYTAQFQQITVYYTASIGGGVIGQNEQCVPFGETAEPVKAEADRGYKFVGWSDGVQTAERTDVVNEIIRVEALFERITFQAKYEAGQGGHITGEAEQTVNYGEAAKPVAAVAEEGYRFVGWSDGEPNAERTDEKVLADLQATAQFEQITFALIYEAGKGGSIDGASSQTVGYWEQAESVTAAPDHGYKFVQWSDGETSATRTDEEPRGDTVITAEFELVFRTYTYNYNKETSEFSWSYQTSNDAENIGLYVGALDGVTLPVPEKEHFTFHGWYLDEEFTEQVADETGALQIGEEIFEEETDTFYAKWTPDEQYTYKILMVVATEVHATLTTVDGIPVRIDYVMPEIARENCAKIADLFSEYLNDIFDGLVLFEVDTYYTTEPLGEENVYISWGQGVGEDVGRLVKMHCIYADKIPEVRSFITEYQSIITLFSFGDYLQHAADLYEINGVAYKKFAAVNILNSAHNYVPDSYLKNIMAICAHEFVHTIEQGMVYEVYEYHVYRDEYGFQTLDDLEGSQLYLTYQGVSITTGKRVGIPFAFWKGEMGNWFEYLGRQY